MADWELSQLAVRSTPAPGDYALLLVPTDHSTPPAGAGGSDQRALISALVAAGLSVSQTASGLITFTATGTQVLLQPPSGYANFTLTAPGDGAQYSNFNLADGTFPLDATGHYWAFSHRADAPAHRLLVYNYNGSTYTNVLQITEAGAITSLHSTLEDGNGNASFGATVTPGAGAATYPPLKLLSGTLMTTAAAGAAEYDGTCFYATAQASSRQVVDAEQFTTLTSPYTLTSQTAAQKLFNASTNGALTVQGSTAYWFECFFTLSSMSASSGSFGFALGGTATLTSQMWETEANKAALATAASAQNTVNTAANTAIATATTNTTGWAKIWGKVRVNAAGTLIPQVSLGVAAAAVVGADSYFRIWPAGASSVTTAGNWS